MVPLLCFYWLVRARQRESHFLYRVRPDQVNCFKISIIVEPIQIREANIGYKSRIQKLSLFGVYVLWALFIN